MLSYTNSNKLTREKNQRVPQYLDNPKNRRALEQGWALGNLHYKNVSKLLTNSVPSIGANYSATIEIDNWTIG